MAESTEKKDQNPNQETCAAQKSKPKSTPIKSKKSANLLFISLIGLVAISSALYALYTSRQMQDDARNQSNAMHTSMIEENARQKKALNSLQAKINSLSQEQKKLKTSFITLNQDLHEALQQRFYQSKDWLLLKARFYLQLAQINAHWSDDRQTTLTLLKQADELLSEHHEEAVFSVRQAINNEITRIQSFKKMDMVGLLSQLDAASQQLIELPFGQSYVLEKEMGATDEEQALKSWSERLKESVNLLEKLVIVRHRDEEIQPLLSNEQEAMLRESIRLNLQQAQWAILHNKAVIYKMSLERAIANITRSFDLDNHSTEVLLQQLHNLQLIEFKQQQPNIQLPLALLNHLIAKNNSKSDGETVNKEAN